MAAEVEICSCVCDENTHTRARPRQFRFLFISMVPFGRKFNAREKRTKRKKIVLWGLRSWKFVSVFFSSSPNVQPRWYPWSCTIHYKTYLYKNTFGAHRIKMCRLLRLLDALFSLSLYFLRCVLFLHSAQRPTKEEKFFHIPFRFPRLTISYH